jgi:BirA family biotin operon repressor/biotin-[acetyl-CoA-carboxylase] ligase
MNETRQAVLRELDSGVASGPALADRLGVSRAAIWKQIEALREAGFEIESGDSGYELIDVPEFGGSAIEFGLDAPFEVEYHDAIPSTNDRARELAAEGREDVVVAADEQTGGRGRLDRAWSSPSGGVWLSLVLRPEIPPTKAPMFTLAAAVAVTRAAREAGVDASIKWPNDVLVETADGDRKLAGILTEMEGEADRIAWLVVGIGVNANVDASALPTGVDATSIREQVGDIDRRLFTQRLLETFDDLRNDVDGILDAWRSHATTLGRRVRIETTEGAVVGTAIDISDPGTLVVETDDGQVSVAAGDCEHLRPE